MSKSLRLLVVLTILAGCGGGSSFDVDAPVKAGGAFDLLAQRMGHLGRLPALYHNILEASPVQEYAVDGRQTYVSELVVSGVVEDVVAGKSFRWTVENGIEVTTEVEFNSPEAWASTVHVTLSVHASAQRPGSAAIGKTIQIGLAFGAPVDVVAIGAELKAMPILAAVLRRSSVFDYDPTVWGVLNDGEFLGFADKNGTRLRFPVLEATASPDFGLGGGRWTVADLVDRKSRPVIKMSTVDGIPTRTGP